MLTWLKGEFENTVIEGLLEGYILQSRYVVLEFLRNDNHADVYSAQEIRIPTTDVHLHIFLKKAEEHWRTYPDRKVRRMLKRDGFLTSFQWDGRRVVVTSATVPPELKFRLADDYYHEFPSLSGTRKEIPPVLEGRKELNDVLAEREDRRREKRASKQREKRRAKREKKRKTDSLN
jgi:hypothetical protein